MTVAGQTRTLAEQVHALLRAAGATLAVAESLTGGALGAALTAVPGASATFRGGVTAYATDLKASLLGVDPALLDRVGAVDAQVARLMAAGARERLGTTYALSTTGVAGPDPQGGVPAGVVHVGLAGPGIGTARTLAVAGGREAVRAAAVRAALRLLADHLQPQAEGTVG